MSKKPKQNKQQKNTKTQKKTPEAKEAELVGIPCKWVPISKTTFCDGTDLKDGRYSQSYHNVPGFGVSQWVVLGYLEVDYQSLEYDGKTREEIIKGCAEFLSQPPPRKKYQKKTPKPPYGNLEPLPAPWLGPDRYSVKPKPGFENRLIVEFITDQRKNKNFWGEGPTFIGGKTKAARKKKEKNK